MTRLCLDDYWIAPDGEFDIDAVDQAFAPGVSAQAVNGLTPDL